MEMVFSAIVVKFSRQRAETAEREANKRVRKGMFAVLCTAFPSR